LRTESKKVSSEESRTPSATPVAFANVRMRPLTPTRNCEGPAAPIVSGGNAFVSAEVAARKLTPRVCGADGAGSETGAEAAGAVASA
jgi:hypothetical protein